MRVTLNIFSTIMSLVSLTYSAVLFIRVLELVGARLGSDVILYAYIMSTLAFISGLTLFKMFKPDGKVVFRNALFGLGAVSTIFWFGFIYQGVSILMQASLADRMLTSRGKTQIKQLHKFTQALNVKFCNF